MAITKQQKIRKENSEKQWLFFYTLLQASDKCSEISGKPLNGEISSTWFHHIYPKSKYPELRYCPENIILVTADEHSEIEASVVYEEVEKKKRFIAEHYEELVESTKEYIEQFLNPIYEHARTKTNFFKKGHKTTPKTNGVYKNNGEKEKKKTSLY